MAETTDWKEVSRPGEMSTWKPVENEELEGTLTGISRDVGVNKSTIYEITTDGDEKVAVWETAVLKSKLEQLELNSKVKLIYLGKRKSKSTPGSYHDYKIFTQSPQLTNIVKKEENGEAIPF
jgi:hypothetical protein